jgi:hypothetical protein
MKALFNDPLKLLDEIGGLVEPPAGVRWHNHGQRGRCRTIADPPVVGEVPGERRRRSGPSSGQHTLSPFTVGRTFGTPSVPQAAFRADVASRALEQTPEEYR